MELAEKKSNSELFTQKVLREFGNAAGSTEVSEYQKKIIQGYFIGIDKQLKLLENNRITKNANNKDHKYDNADPINWNTIDLGQLALDVMHFASMGVDIQQDNHIFAIPFKDNKRLAKDGKSKLYVVNLILGYNGIRYIAEKYAAEPFKNVIAELVYSTDQFTITKKDRTHDVESYEFEVVNPFNRGEIIGGFGYIEYDDSTKNKLIIMTKKDFEKRKPEHASPEFWGGKAKRYVNGVVTEVENEGWYAEMCMKTLKREVYSPKHIPIDPKKVDDNYQYMKMQELRIEAAKLDNTICETESTPVGIEMSEQLHSVEELKQEQPQPVKTAPF